MSALEVALILGVNLDCSRPISPQSIVRAKGTFSATASHTSVRWLSKDKETRLWVSQPPALAGKSPFGPPGKTLTRG